MAPPKWRGALSSIFQLFMGSGVVAAGCINYGTARLSWGWRPSLCLAAVAAAIMTLGALLISDTPSSLVERGKLEKAKQTLAKVRRNDTDIDPEFPHLVKSSEIAKSEAVACVLATTAGEGGTRHISKGDAALSIILMGIFAAGFDWSWGPL